MTNLLKKNRWTLLSLFIIIPVGFFCKFYQGYFYEWMSNSLAGVFYEIFWCLLIFLFMKKKALWKIATAVFTITCALEFLQLWHPPFLEIIRSNFIGRSVIGTSFVPSDFYYYIIGSLMGWMWLVILKKQYIMNESRSKTKKEVKCI
jgi:hypothetical protein